MARKKKKNQINLLPKYGMTSTVAGRVTLWVLSSFRIVVIVTEIIVMIAFLSRFWLDAQNTDLNDEIEQKVKVLSATQNSERQFRDIQERLNTYSEVNEQQTSINRGFVKLSEVVPTEIDTTAYSYNEGILTVEGESSNERLIQQYLANLSAVSEFENIRLVSLEGVRESPTRLRFQILITYKP